MKDRYLVLSGVSEFLPYLYIRLVAADLSYEDREAWENKRSFRERNMHNPLDQHQPLLLKIAVTCTALASLFLSGGMASAVTFSTPKGVAGTPRTQTSGGASRNGGQCLSPSGTVSSEAMALLPPTTQALTVSGRPTFFVYVPPTTAKEASFSLQDEYGELHYQTKVALPENGGALSIPLPETASTLVEGKTYQWFFEIHCAAQFDPDNPIIEGSVSRTPMAPGLESELAASHTALERVQLYAEAGIWYDTLGTLAQARQERPQDSALAQSWQELLNSVGLHEIANTPVVEGYNIATHRN